MKHLFIIGTVSLLLFSACAKDEKPVLEAPISKKEILTKKIQDIIPENYLDSLKKLGMTIYPEANPPKLEGAYAISPAILLKSSHPRDWPVGHRFTDAKVKFSNQNDNFDIHMLGKDFLRQRDTSIVTAISGSGNNFTVYGKVKSTVGNKVAIFALIISGTKTDIDIQGLKYVLFNIDNSKGSDADFIPEGFGRMIHDFDGSSALISPEQF